MKTLTRAPKQLGDFGEGLVTYLLIRNNFEVAVVDHVGADLIAEKDGQRFAISVKTRLFREGSKESRAFVIENFHLEKLKHFANLFGLKPIYAQVVCLADEKIIHICALSMNFVEGLNIGKHGYCLRMQKKADLAHLSKEAFLYACLNEEQMRTADLSACAIKS